MTRYYLDLPVLDRTDPTSTFRMGTAEIMAVSGKNIGNFAFRHALQFMLADLPSYEIVRYQAFQRAAREGRVEQTIVSCANWLGTSKADEDSNRNRANAFGATDTNIVCFGLGVQAKQGDECPDLGPETIRLAKVLAERAHSLSVRDEITQRTLELHGIRNTVVTGCPSNFINGDPQLGDLVARRAEQHRDRIQSWNGLRTVFNEFSGGNPASGQVLQAMLRLMETSPAFYVLQSPTLLPFLLNESREIPAMYRSNSPFPKDKVRLRRALRSKAMFFSSIDAWMDFARTCDFSCGMRIHGSMIPLQAGVPSVLVSHDSRTSGLAGIMGIPSVSAKEFGTGLWREPRALLDSVAETMTEYDGRRRDLAGLMCDYIRNNGLLAHASLLGLAGRNPAKPAI